MELRSTSLLGNERTRNFCHFGTANELFDCRTEQGHLSDFGHSLNCGVAVLIYSQLKLVLSSQVWMSLKYIDLISNFDIDLALFRRSNASKHIGRTFAKPNRAWQKVLGELGVVLKTSKSRTEPKFLSLAMTYPSHLTLICPNN